ncbi:MAG: hypothetical protein AAFR59_04870, partial [Bacteroidota bacterium]
NYYTLFLAFDSQTQADLYAQSVVQIQLKTAIYEVLLAHNQLVQIYNAQAAVDDAPPMIHTTFFYDFRAKRRKQVLNPNVLIP